MLLNTAADALPVAEETLSRSKKRTLILVKIFAFEGVFRFWYNLKKTVNYVELYQIIYNYD